MSWTDLVQTAYVDEDITNFFLKKLKYYSSHKKFYSKSNVMHGEYFGTINLLPIMDNEFFTYAERIKNKVEEVVSYSLLYNYIHMLDYTKGGKMGLHNHIHAEDYSSLLYLNDSNDGATFFIVDGKRQYVSPEKNKLLMYPSHVVHGSEESTSKKVLVNGYKFKYNFI